MNRRLVWWMTSKNPMCKARPECFHLHALKKGPKWAAKNHRTRSLGRCGRSTCAVLRMYEAVNVSGPLTLGQRLRRLSGPICLPLSDLRLPSDLLAQCAPCASRSFGVFGVFWKLRDGEGKTSASRDDASFWDEPVGWRCATVSRRGAIPRCWDRLRRIGGWWISRDVATIASLLVCVAARYSCFPTE